MRELLYHSGVDHSVATWATNYAIGGVGVIVALFILLRRRLVANPLLGALHAGATGAGFAVAGLGHQEYHDSETGEWRAVFAVQCVLVGLGYAFLTHIAHLHAQREWEGYELRVPTAWVMAANVVVGLALTIASPILNTLQPLFLYLLLVILFAGALGFGMRKWSLVLYTAVTLAGMIIAAANAGNCSKEDTSDCTFPDKFNHNAVYHVIQAVALVIYYVYHAYSNLAGTLA